MRPLRRRGPENRWFKFFSSFLYYRAMAFQLRVSPPPLSATKTLSSAGSSPVLSSSHAKQVSELSSSGSSSDSDPSSSDSDADPDSDSDTSSGSNDGISSKNTPGWKFGPVPEDYLYALLEKAKVNMRLKVQTKAKGKEKAKAATASRT